MGSRSGTSSGAQAAHARPISTSFQVADHTECITPPPGLHGPGPFPATVTETVPTNYPARQRRSEIICRCAMISRAAKAGSSSCSTSTFSIQAVHAAGESAGSSTNSAMARVVALDNPIEMKDMSVGRGTPSSSIISISTTSTVICRPSSPAACATTSAKQDKYLGASKRAISSTSAITWRIRLG